MDRSELRLMLERSKIRREVYDLTGRECTECYRLEHIAGGWVVYYSERGVRSGERLFPSEDEACRYLAERLLTDPGAQETYPRYPRADN